MQTTVVIPTYCRADSLARSLKALAGQQLPPSEVIVVARPEDHGARAVVSEAASAVAIRVADVSTPGLVAALNAGLAAAAGDVVAFTDDDAEPHPDWLRRIDQLFGSDERIGGVGGRDWVYYGEELVPGAEPVVGRLAWYGRTVGNHHAGVGGTRDVHVLKGANMAFRRAAVGNRRFDARLTGVGTEHHSELGLCLHLLSQGWRVVYDPAVAVDHRPAPRVEGHRELAQERVIRCSAHNETLALLEYLPAWRRVAFLLWAGSVGNVALPGPLQLLRSAAGGGHLGWRAVRGALAGRLDGWRTYRRARGSQPDKRGVLAIGHSAYAAERARQLLRGRDRTLVVSAGAGAPGAWRASRAVVATRGRTVYLVDVGVSTSVAAVVARLLRRAVVVDTGDLGYELARSVGGRSGLGLAAVRVGERVALWCANHVVVRGHGHLSYLNGAPATVVPDLAPEGAAPARGGAVRARLELPEDAYVAGLVGSLNYSPRLGRCYGWDLVRALGCVPNAVHALIVGDGDGRQWLEREADRLGVADRCHFVGRVDPSEVSEWIAAMDAAISTQTNDAVGSVRTTGKLPLYLACGCPVLASHVGEAARLLGPLGWTVRYEGTVDERYPARLGSAIAAWAADPSSQEHRRLDALRVAGEAFDPEDMRGRLGGVLDTVGSA